MIDLARRWIQPCAIGCPLLMYPRDVNLVEAHHFDQSPAWQVDGAWLGDDRPGSWGNRQRRRRHRSRFTAMRALCRDDHTDADRADCSCDPEFHRQAFNAPLRNSRQRATEGAGFGAARCSRVNRRKIHRSDD